MNSSIDSAIHPSSISSTDKPRRPGWFWFLLFLPPAATFISMMMDGLAYRPHGGGDGLHDFVSAISLCRFSSMLSLISSVFLTGWMVRHRTDKLPAFPVALTSYSWLQLWNLSLTIAGCESGAWAARTLFR